MDQITHLVVSAFLHSAGIHAAKQRQRDRNCKKLWNREKLKNFHIMHKKEDWRNFAHFVAFCRTLFAISLFCVVVYL